MDEDGPIEPVPVFCPYRGNAAGCPFAQKDCAKPSAENDPLEPFRSDASLEPWCLVPLADGTEVLFGYAHRHPVTGGHSWMRSSPVISVQENRGRAVTGSGCRYALGRRVDDYEVPDEGEEAWIAFDLLIGEAAADPTAVSRISTDREFDNLWLITRKMARLLGAEAPGRFPRDVEEIIVRYAAASHAKSDGCA